MKKLLTVLMLFISLNANAQNVVLNGNTFSTKGRTVHKDTLVTKYFFENRQGKWKIIINKKSGSCYYWTKTKDGRMQVRYCPTELSQKIAGEYKIKYNKSKK